MSDAMLAVIPKPAVCEAKAGAFTPDQAVRVAAPQWESEPGLERATAELAQAMSEATRGTAVRVTPSDVEPESRGVITLQYASDAEAVAESYRLEVTPDRIAIEAGDAAGLYYGIQTLRQLIAAAEGGAVPCCRIEDRPRFGWRGFMLDSARHFQPVAWVKRHIDRMAALKLNRLHWHLVDDQGWRVEIGRYPRLTEVAAWWGVGEHREGGYYTQQELREVVAYAAERFITVVPEIEMPGHCNAALVAYPELSCAGEPLEVADRGWDAYTAKAGRLTFCAGREATFTFIENVLREVAEIFDSSFVHIGGDERPKGGWEACPRCNAEAARLGVDGMAGLQAAFMQRVADFCRVTFGRRTIAWGDCLEAGLPEGQVVQGWHAGQSAAAARLGHATINSNHEWVYLDYPAFDRDRASRPDWMLVLPLEKIYHFDPVPDGLEPGLHAQVWGSEAAMWTEFVADEAELEKQLMPRLAAFGEVVWSPRWTRSFDEFADRLGVHQRLGTFAIVGSGQAAMAG